MGIVLGELFQLAHGHLEGFHVQDAVYNARLCPGQIDVALRSAASQDYGKCHRESAAHPHSPKAAFGILRHRSLETLPMAPMRTFFFGLFLVRVYHQEVAEGKGLVGCLPGDEARRRDRVAQRHS